MFVHPVRIFLVCSGRGEAGSFPALLAEREQPPFLLRQGRGIGKALGTGYRPRPQEIQYFGQDTEFWIKRACKEIYPIDIKTIITVSKLVYYLLIKGVMNSDRFVKTYAKGGGIERGRLIFSGWRRDGNPISCPKEGRRRTSGPESARRGGFIEERSTTKA